MNLFEIAKTVADQSLLVKPNSFETPKIEQLLFLEYQKDPSKDLKEPYTVQDVYEFISVLEEFGLTVTTKDNKFYVTTESEDIEGQNYLYKIIDRGPFDFDFDFSQKHQLISW